MLAKLLSGAQRSVGIQYVGGTTASTTGTTATWTASLTSLTGGIASSPSEGDLVLVYYGNGSVNNDDLTATGYTQLEKLFSDDTTKTNLFVGYKFMGSTPDATVALSQTFSTNSAGAVAIQVWRNVESVMPLDVKSSTATGTNSVLANPPAITPVTTGAIIVAGGAGGHNAGAQTYSSSDLTGFLSVGGNSSQDSTVGLGYKTWTSGAFNPAAFTFSTGDSAQYSWAAVTLALIPNQETSPPTFVASAQTQNSTPGDSLVINKPTGTVQGDLMVAFMAAGGVGNNTWSGDGGWTEVADQGGGAALRVAYKVAGASEPSSYTFTCSTDGEELSGAILAYRGAAYEAIGSIVTNSNPLTPTGPTENTPLRRLLGFACRPAGGVTITSTMTTRRAFDSGAASPSWYVGDEVVPLGATGTRSFTLGSSTGVSAVLLTIKPA